MGHLPDRRRDAIGVGQVFPIGDLERIEKGARFVVSIDILAADASRHVWICPPGRTCRVLGIDEIHSVVGGASAAVQPRRCQGTEAPAAGDVLTTATFDLTATIDTVVSATLTATIADRLLAEGDRLALEFSGTIAGLVGCVTFDLLFES